MATFTAGGDLLWKDDTITGSGIALAVGSDGTLFVNGNHDGFGTFAYDPETGTQLWGAVYDDGFLDQDMALSPDGSRVFVTGQVVSGTTNFATVAYDALTGEQLWDATLDGIKHGMDDPCCVAVSPDSSTVYVAGGSEGSSFRLHYVVVAYDAATGAERWRALCDSMTGADDIPAALGVSPDGSKVFVTGSTGFPLDMTTVALDAQDGHRRWLRVYDDPGHRDDEAKALAVSPDGSRVAIIGRTWGGRQRADEITTAVYDSATGHLRWARRFGGPNDDFPTAIAYDPAGTGLFVTGYGSIATANTDFVTIGYDAATGQRRWAESYDGPDHRTDRASALALSPDGTTVFVTGKTDPLASTQDDYEVLAYDAATGATIWSTRYSLTQDSDDEPCCIGVSPDGSKVFLTGFTDHGSGTKTYLTMAFQA